VRGVPVTRRNGEIPQAAKGIDIMIRKGSLKDSNCDASIMYMRIIESIIETANSFFSFL
jgi:hypothetical protein